MLARLLHHLLKRMQGRHPVFMVNQGAAGEQVRVNLRTQVNAADIRMVNEDGREYMVIPSYTLPDGVVMNGGLYTKEEIDKSFASLEETPAPVGHPFVDGKYISAFHPKATNAFYAGAFNRNVRREGHRVALDKYVDMEFAQNSIAGRKLLEAVANKQPVHTSTGILLEQEPVAANANLGYAWIARNMRFDHDAILINETGAATPDQGVGLFVNVSDAVPVPEATPEEDGMIKKILNMLRGHVVSEPAITPNSEALDMTPEELQALLDAQAAKQQDAIVSAVNAAVAPLQAIVTEVQASNTALTAQLKANTDAAEADKRTAVTAEFGEVVANAASGAVLDALFAKCAIAAPLLHGMPVINTKSSGLADTLPE